MKKTSLELPDDLWLRVRQAGLAHGISFKDFVAQALEAYLQILPAKKAGLNLATVGEAVKGINKAADRLSEREVAKRAN